MTTTKQQPTKRLTLSEAFKLWMTAGIGRSALTSQTGLSKGALHKAFVKLAKKPWGQLNEERKGGKKSARKSRAA